MYVDNPQVVIFVIYFPLSYKLSTGVSSVVMKRAFEALRIQQGQHNKRSPLDVGFDFVLKCKCNILVIVNLCKYK